VNSGAPEGLTFSSPLVTHEGYASNMSLVNKGLKIPKG
jgi:hypothetical protein